jgi:hypothetical protein
MDVEKGEARGPRPTLLVCGNNPRAGRSNRASQPSLNIVSLRQKSGIRKSYKLLDLLDA